MSQATFATRRAHSIGSKLNHQAPMKLPGCRSEIQGKTRYVPFAPTPCAPPTLVSVCSSAYDPPLPLYELLHGRKAHPLLPASYDTLVSLPLVRSSSSPCLYNAQVGLPLVRSSSSSPPLTTHRLTRHSYAHPLLLPL